MFLLKLVHNTLFYLVKDSPNVMGQSRRSPFKFRDLLWFSLPAHPTFVREAELRRRRISWQHHQGVLRRRQFRRRKRRDALAFLLSSHRCSIVAAAAIISVRIVNEGEDEAPRFRLIRRCALIGGEGGRIKRHSHILF